MCEKYVRTVEHTKVGIPSEPSTVTSINVHGNVGEIETLQGICNTVFVTLGRCLATCQVGVGDQVRKGVGLDDKSNRDIGSCLDSGNNC